MPLIIVFLTHAARFIRARVFRGGRDERKTERETKRDRIKNVLNLLKQFIKKATCDRQDASQYMNIRQLLRTQTTASHNTQIKRTTSDIKTEHRDCHVTA